MRGFTVQQGNSKKKILGAALFDENEKNRQCMMKTKDSHYFKDIHSPETFLKDLPQQKRHLRLLNLHLHLGTNE